MNKKFDIVKVGYKQNKLTVISDVFRINGYKYVNICCECGVKKKMRISNIINDNTKSCGCDNNSLKHGMCYKRQYNMYQNMIRRCYETNNIKYNRYGGRGIRVCDEWMGENGFINWWEWAKNNGYSDKLTIDRIDNDGNYCPENCKFSTLTEQARNRSTNCVVTAFKEEKCLSEWANDSRCVVNQFTLRKRIFELGWEPEKAITTKINKEIKN